MAARSRRLGAVMTAFIGTVFGVVVFAAASDAAPYISQPTLSVSTQNPTEGASLGVSGAGYGANEQVNLTLQSATYNLGSAMTDGSGSFSTTVTLPAGVTGTHTIVGVGATYADVASVGIVISAATGGGGGGGGGGLPNTGAAVMGLGGVGVALLLGGGLMLLAGKRRKVAV